MNKTCKGVAALALLGAMLGATTASAGTVTFSLGSDSLPANNGSYARVSNNDTTGTVLRVDRLDVAAGHEQDKDVAVLRVHVRMADASERVWDQTASQLQPSVGQRVAVKNDQLVAN